MSVAELQFANAAANDAGRAAIDGYWQKLYGQVRRWAADCMRGERVGHTLSATALVHEAYLRMARQRSVGWNDPAQFVGAASKVMRRVLVDHARRKTAAKRRPEAAPPTDEGLMDPNRPEAIDLVALDDALHGLSALDPRKAAIVELRFFGGLSLEEIAGLLQTSLRTIERDWTMAKAWLRVALDKSGASQ